MAWSVDESQGAPAQSIREARAALLTAHQRGDPPHDVAADYSQRITDIVTKCWISMGPPSSLALVALGGLSRLRLAPFSDVDLWIVDPSDSGSTGVYGSKLSRILWDAGLESSVIVRSVDETRAWAKQDLTVATCLFEARTVAGDPSIVAALTAWAADPSAGCWTESFRAERLADWERRRARAGGSPFVLEPHLKTGVGGLRDLDAALWLAHARWGPEARGLSGCRAVGLLTAVQEQALRDARGVVLQIRHQLHLQAGRRDDRLTFTAQDMAAPNLGYVDGPAGTAPEQLMRAYYLAAHTIARGASRLVSRCLSRSSASSVRISDERWEVGPEGLRFRSGPTIDADPAAWVEAFVVAESEGVAVDPQTLEAIGAGVDADGGRAGADPRATQVLLRYLASSGSTGAALDGLYDAGVLGAVVPAFGRLRGRVQRDASHAYTVDAHTVQALKQLLRLRSGLTSTGDRAFDARARQIDCPEGVALGVLFHDLGKGMGGDHSRRGAELVRDFGAAAGRASPEVDLAAFLVAEHLTLSSVALRRDLSDPVLIEQVARRMGDACRLDALHVLTWADISSVGPETWNAWRSRLIGTLWAECRRRLQDPDPSPTSIDRAEQASRRRDDLLRHPSARVDPASARRMARFVDVCPEKYLATVALSTALADCELWGRAIDRSGCPLEWAARRHAAIPDATELVVVAADAPGLLARLAGVLAAHGVDIVAAEIVTLEGGMVLDRFWVREPGGQGAGDQRLLSALSDAAAVVNGRGSVSEIIERRGGRSVSRRVGPTFVPRVRFDPQARAGATAIDVVAPDRPGLLYDLAHALHAWGLGIVWASIQTEAGRATDSFYVVQSDGGLFDTPAGQESLARTLIAVSGAPVGVESVDVG